MAELRVIVTFVVLCMDATAVIPLPARMPVDLVTKPTAPPGPTSVALVHMGYTSHVGRP